MKWKDENINWRIKGKDFWIQNNYHLLKMKEKQAFLKRYGLDARAVPVCRKCRHVYWNCKCGDKEYEQKIELRKKLMYASFEEKLKHSRELVKEILEKHKNDKIYLAYSGGIDSECCLQLFKEAIKEGKVQIVWADTLVEFPETRERINEVEKELGIKIIRAVPSKGNTFKSIVERFGLPLGPRGKTGGERLATIRCCSLLKKSPIVQATKGYKVTIMGLRMFENKYRKLALLNRGDYFYASDKKKFRVYPIAYWTIDDVWKFQEQEGFNYNKIYDKTNCKKKGFFKLSNGQYYEIRTGCWSCPQARKLGYLEWLKEYYPKYYDVLMNQFGLKKVVLREQLEEKKQKLKEGNVKPCGEKL